MRKTKKRKKFDCVEMMHQGAERVRQQTAGMSLEEELAYWREKTQELLDLKAKMQGVRKAS